MTERWTDEPNDKLEDAERFAFLARHLSGMGQSVPGESIAFHCDFSSETSVKIQGTFRKAIDSARKIVARHEAQNG